MLLLVARLVDVQVLHAGAYEAAARGESSITVSLPSLRGGIYAPRRVTPGHVGADRRRRRRRLPGRPSRADGARALADAPRPRHHARRRSCTGPRAMSSWPGSCPKSRAEDLGRRLPRHHADRRLQAARAQRKPGGAGRRVHQRGRARAPPASSTGTTSSWRERPARRRSWSRRPAWRCRSHPVDQPGRHVAGHGAGAHPRHPAPVRVRAGAGQGDRVLERRERHRRA